MEHMRNMAVTQHTPLTWPDISNKKMAKLLNILRRMESVVVAYSGGVDSSFLGAVAHVALRRQMLAVTAVSPTFPRRDLRDACHQAHRYGWKHKVITTQELDDDRFACNPTDRCYYCKAELFGRLRKIADKKHFQWVADGSNLDDLNDYRPGAKAKAEFKIRSPLQEAGFTKADVRALSRTIGLATADKPAAACLASRFPYGTRITEARLKAVEKAENMLLKLGFTQIRVRSHGEIARIELDRAEVGQAWVEPQRSQISRGLKKIGFRYIAIDLDGYRTGSMNEGVTRLSSRRRLKPN